ncbi:hypothetical protein EMCRGX_G024444 [Ephydatia muelleri]
MGVDIDIGGCAWFTWHNGPFYQRSYAYNCGCWPRPPEVEHTKELGLEWNSNKAHFIQRQGWSGTVCIAIAAVFRKKRKYFRSYKEHRDCHERTECEENRYGPNISSNDGSGILPTVKSSQHSPSRLKEEKFFRIYNVKLAPMGTSKYNSLLILSDFWMDVFNTYAPVDTVSKSTSLPSGINVCGRSQSVTETNHNAMYHHRGHAAAGYLSQKDHMSDSQNIIQSHTHDFIQSHAHDVIQSHAHDATLHVDHHLRDRLVTTNGRMIYSGTLV